MQYRSAIIGFIVFSLINTVYGQSIIDNLKSHEQKGDGLYESQYYDQAITHYKKALASRPSDPRLNLQIAICYNELDEWESSEEWFLSVEQTDPEVITEEYAFQYGDVLQHLGKFTRANLWYQRASNGQPKSATLKNRLKAIEKVKEFYVDSSSYYVTELPFNTDAAEFSPLLYRGGLIFTSYASLQRKQIPARRKDIRYDMYYFPLEQSYEEAAIEGQFALINSSHHEGTLATYKDDNRMIFTRSNAQSSKELKSKGIKIKHLGLFYAEFNTKDNVWDKIKPLNINNSEYSVGHPTISKDGRTLYFVSDMPGGFGGTDIYQSKFENDRWSTPKNMGPTVNTEANELFPFLHGDTVLYFASDGHPGLGGLDIFKTNLNGGVDAAAKNMGYPVNSTGDDFGLIIGKNGLEGFFTSNRQAEKLKDNIYRFTFIEDHLLDKNVAEEDPQDETPQKEWLELRGTVVNKEDKSPLSDAKVVIVDLDSRAETETTTDSLGWFKVGIESADSYFIRTEKDNFYMYKASIPYDTLAKNKLNHFVEMEEIQVGQKFKLENIYYEVGAYEVTGEDTEPLDEIVEFLEDNPDIKIELSSHTDSRGSDAFNLSLSQKRAKAAAEYIISQGIDITRVKAVGYGETRLEFPCGNGIECSDEQHLMNRRTEITIIEH